MIIVCKGRIHNGYGYFLKKIINLKESGFHLQYELENTGFKPLKTSEYVHNFLAVNHTSIDNSYQLFFDETIKPELFEETVNPGGLVQFKGRETGFSGIPEKPFFFSHLFGAKSVSAKWRLLNRNFKMAISETGDFRTSKVNLWGWQHVVSPELFINLKLEPGQSASWSRCFLIEEVN